MADNDDEKTATSSSDDDDDDNEEGEDSTSSSSSSSSDDEEDNEPAEDDSDATSTSSTNKQTPKQVYLSLETKRKTLGKRLLELRDELKAQPQADIDVKKRLLTEIKNLREKWIAVQTRLTNAKARLSHSPTPERETRPTPVKQVSPAPKPKVIASVETRIIPPPRLRTYSYSSSDRSRSSSRESRKPTSKPYRDLDALDNDGNRAGGALSSRPTTSYRDLTDDRALSLSPSPEPSESQITSDSMPLSNLDPLSLIESRISAAERPDELEDNLAVPDELFTNADIPYPIVNDKRDLEVVNRQVKNQLRQFEASRNNPSYDQQADSGVLERLKKQNEYINVRMRIERLKRMKTKTQREKEQNKKQFHHLLQEFRKLQRFMRSANRDSVSNQSFIPEREMLPSSIPLPPSPEPKLADEFQLPPLDLHRVTGKKTLFESSDSDDNDDEPVSQPQVPVSLSISEPRTVPEEFNSRQQPAMPLPSSSSSSATLDAIRTRVTNLMNATPSASSSQIEGPTPTAPVVDDDDEENDGDDQPEAAPEKAQGISAKFNRKRRKTKRNKNKKKNANAANAQGMSNENEPAAIDQEEAWKRHVAMQLQFHFLKRSNPILRALTAEAHKKLGVSQEDINDFSFDDDDMMDYETAMILQQQQEFLAAAAANPFNVLHNAAAGSSSSRPNLVDILSNLNGGTLASSSEPQTPMGLLQKFFLDASNNSNAERRANLGLNDPSTTPPTPPTQRDISIGKKIVQSLTHQDINALLKLSGSEHDDDDDDDDDNDHPSIDDDTDDDMNHLSFDDDSNDVPNGGRNYERWERPNPATSRASSLNNKKSAMETLILPSFNRCTHLGKSTKRAAGVERMFPSFSKHNAGPSSTLSLILYGLSTAP